MLDAAARRVLDAPLGRLAAGLDRPGVTPDRLTGLGLALGLGSAVTAALQLWAVALVLWLVSRLADGLDGPLARRRRARGAPGDAGSGGFFDITADFCVYGTTVVGVAIGAARGHGAPVWPFLLVLLAYYVNGTAFLAFSSIAERSGRRLDDGRSLSFLGGLAEGTETIVVHSLWLLLPQHADVVAGCWAALVALSAGQRVVAGYRALR
ncbi:CDP-alcohol phosphatidyltransferase family protein [Geodermatophilus sp. YIM 151500]|uniref:CDP-alcohol phosphatidyltransferase family protein n=1 Tax=Geodermatophilus sp. YIM 151500 TaxID=2984531 RepID=UPI0021E45CD2|nr:CDP-alcohol phosphatidyltransferase family protein [Geodermatophilus sp. YIM 151500]MCV2490130.1 CDP-alcohol phosphatidyltransferase family protein [Geodermatophilus sp. YIM 151500]